MWMRASLGNLGCRFFPFITLNILCHAILACRVSAEKSADKLMGVPFYVVSFPLLLLIFFFILNFCQFDYHSLMCSSLGLSAWDSLLLLGLGWLFPFPCWWSFQQYFSSKPFSFRYINYLYNLIVDGSQICNSSLPSKDQICISNFLDSTFRYSVGKPSLKNQKSIPPSLYPTNGTLTLTLI